MRFNRIQSQMLAFHFQLQHVAPLNYHALKSVPSFRYHSPTTPSYQRTSILLSPSDLAQSRNRKIAVIGGGASGMFAATAAADYLQKYNITGCDVTVFEGTSRTMSKVRISGGGRCNVMHDRTKLLPQILGSYPRGHKELRGLYTKRFTPNDAYDWFTSRGVQLKTESDGRMFPITDDSQTIIDVISNAAIRAGVRLETKQKVENVEWRESRDEGTNYFIVQLSSKLDSQQRVFKEKKFDSVILATGSFPIGHEIARSLGHKIVMPVPSLFTFDAKELVKEGGLFHGLAGLSVQIARLTLKVPDEMQSFSNEALSSKSNQSDATITSSKKKKSKTKSIIQEGPLLITHHGISGPATLRLSAFAAREFHAMKYKCDVEIHFCPKWEEQQRRDGAKGSSEAILTDELWKMSLMIPKRKVSTGCPLFMKELEEGSALIPKRLWQALVQHSSISPDTTWGDTSKSMIRSLASSLSSFSLTVTGKGTFKEEFVTAGGIHLKEVNMTNMESKIVPGLFMCGEVLDVDGITGGFNFMGCWSTGFVAGEGSAEFCNEKRIGVSLDDCA